jgi:hypothetical protein
LAICYVHSTRMDDVLILQCQYATGVRRSFLPLGMICIERKESPSPPDFWVRTVTVHSFVSALFIGRYQAAQAAAF